MSADRGLAAERTTLAWRRNGVSLIAAGLAIVRGIPAPSRGIDGRPVLGLGVLALGVLTFAVGARQAARRARHLDAGRPAADLADLWPVTAATTLVALAAVAISLVR